MNTTEIITDYAGNQYPASRLNEPESPSFDTWGAKKDQAWKALGGIMAGIVLPKVGDTVTIHHGRKHKGKVGIVFWRGRDAYQGREYGNDMQRCMSSAMGFGQRIGVKTDSGDKFFVKLRDTVLD